jgi:hypothetical protein
MVCRSYLWIANIGDRSNTATAIGTYTAFQSIATLLASFLAGLIWFYAGASTTFLVNCRRSKFSRHYGYLFAHFRLTLRSTEFLVPQSPLDYRHAKIEAGNILSSYPDRSYAFKRTDTDS